MLLILLLLWTKYFKGESKSKSSDEDKIQQIEKQTELYLKKNSASENTNFEEAFQMAGNGNWSELENWINKTQNNFAEKLRSNYATLTEDDFHIIFLLRTKKDHAEIAEFLNIKMSSFRVRRGRLKKKMNVECNSFTDYINSLYL